jgi:hypothetical protein
MVRVAFDTDGCLIHQNEAGEDVPRYDVIQLYHCYEKFGCEMYIWSGSGLDHARRWRNKLGLMTATVVAKGSFVPEIAVDDMEITLGKVNIQVKE